MIVWKLAPCIGLALGLGCSWHPDHPLRLAMWVEQGQARTGSGIGPRAEAPGEPADRCALVPAKPIRSNRALSLASRFDDRPYTPSVIAARTDDSADHPALHPNGSESTPEILSLPAATDAAVSLQNRDDARTSAFSVRCGVITPSQVFSLATRINEAILKADAVRVSARVSEIEAATPEGVIGKKPGDVFARVQRLAELTDRVRHDAGLGPIPRVPRHATAVTPAEVYLAVGECLDGLVEWVAAGRRREPFGTLYRTQNASGKAPDDVFALVDLAVRRLEKLLDATSGQGADSQGPPRGLSGAGRARIADPAR